MISETDIVALWITLRLAALSTFILLLIGTPLAWWLARRRSPLRVMVEALVALPLVMPPTVLGFYLLLLLSPNNPLGTLMQHLGMGTLAFSFSGLVVGSVFYSMPFVIQPLHNAFVAVGQTMPEAAATLRASPMDRFFTVIVPMARPGFISAAVLGFAHTLGEFGVVLMIGGNIPGETQVLSIAIYDHVEALEYGHAHVLSASLVLLSFVMLLALYAMNHRFLVSPRHD